MTPTARLAGVIVTLVVAAGVVAQAPPRAGFPVEEVDPSPPGQLKTIVVDDDIPPDVPDGAYYVRLPGVAQVAANAPDPAVKQFLTRFSVAFDQITQANGRRTRVTPLPLMFPDDRKKFPDPFGIVPLDGRNGPGEVASISPRTVRRIEPFEALAVAGADELLADMNGPSEAVTLAAAEVVLSDTLLFHGTARDQNRRRGDGWAAVADALATRLTDVRVRRVDRAVADGDWPLVRTLTARIIADPRYARDRPVLEAAFAARLADAEATAKSNRVPDLERLRDRLVEFEAQFPDSQSAVAGRVRESLNTRAGAMFEEAERVASLDPGRARNLLKTVEALNPDHPGLRDSQRDLKSGYAVLVVGTRRLPERMSPSTARFDSERQAVELVFEGLLEAVPDLPPTATGDGGLGIRYAPALAAEHPLAADGGRDIPLTLSALWAGPSSGPRQGRVDTADVVGTVEMLRDGGSWAADPVDWLGDPVPDPADPARVRIALRRGHPDPRSLLTFKVLPARRLKQDGTSADDLGFARTPVGTGPFRLDRAEPGRDVVFVSNPAYGRRPGVAGLPGIKEVRFTDVTIKPDLAAEFRADRLHLLPDVPTGDLPLFQAEANLGGKVRIVTAQTPRQIHLLAVNHRRPALRSADLRRGLALAIDREQILNDVFRAGQDRYHKALTGPFPPDSWATPGSGGDALVDRDLATAKLKAYREAGGSATLSLAYPDDDPQAKMACEAIRKAVTDTGAGVTLNLVPVPPAKLADVTTQLHSYDLAYVTFDYRDDWYPLRLGSYLDPTAAGSNGRNICGYLTPTSDPTPDDDELGRLLAQARLYRDLDGKLLPLAHDIHRRFNATMPFVPLWLLDRHTVIANSVKVRLDGWSTETPAQLLDPSTLFGSVELWEMR